MLCMYISRKKKRVIHPFFEWATQQYTVLIQVGAMIRKAVKPH